MSFIHLHTHSDFSPQDGAQTVEMIVKKAAKLKMDSVALTDHGRAGGLIALKKGCEEHNVKPIYGFEAYVSPENRFLKEKIEDEKNFYHLVLLAKNKTGLENIFRLTSIGWRDGFYYKPRIDLEVLKEHSEGLVCLTGCGSGRVAVKLLEDKKDEAIAHVEFLKEIFGEDLYIEVQNHGLDWQQQLKKQLFSLAKELDCPIVATQDSHYQEKEDAEMHSAICKLAAGDLQFDSEESYFKSEEQMKEMFTEDEWHAITRTQEVADKCNCNWEFGATIWPDYKLPDGVTPAQQLRKQAEEGFKKLFPNPTSEYIERFEHELKVIEKMGFPTYFLVVSDLLEWARTNNIYTGYGRGSAAGSLICYCVGITKVDPIKYGLYFERFLNVDRISLPDVDMDIAPSGRKRVMEYVYSKYGEDKCAQIGTYFIFKPRGSLRNFTRVLGYDLKTGEKLSKLVPPDRHGKQLSFKQILEESKELRDTEHQDILRIAQKAEGMNSGAGVHPAGVLISNKEIYSQVPLFRGKHDEIASQFDMHEVEEIGLVKYDLLGLKTLDVIQKAIDVIKDTKNIDIDIFNIDTEDQKVFENIFQQGKLAGIFQFENSSGFRDLCIKIKPKTVEDLSAITALFRPGPLTAKEDPNDSSSRNLVQKYIDGRNGEKVNYLFPELEPILKDTYGVMVYQEQIMRICTDCAGYTLAEADNMRKIIGKKLPEKMAAEKDKLINGCIENGIAKEKAEELFEQIEGFAAYSFNKAHSVAYSFLSFCTAWLKYYYQQELYCGLLNTSLDNQDDVIKYIHSLKEDEISVLPPDINLSQPGFTSVEDTIVFGFAGVKGIGEKAALDLVEKRPNGGFSSLSEIINNKINKGVITSLLMCGAIEEITDVSRIELVEKLDEIIKYYKKEERIKEKKLEIIERTKEIEAWNLNPIGKKPRRKSLTKNDVLPDFPELNNENLDTKKRLRFEREKLGFYVTGHPMDSYPGLSSMAEFTVAEVKDGKADTGTKLNLPIVISSISKRRTKKDKTWAILMVEDKTGRVEAPVFPRQWNKIGHLLEEDFVYVLRCSVKVEESDDENTPPIVSLIVNDVTKVDEDAQIIEMKKIDFSLKDDTIIEFVPGKEQNYYKWQQAVAFIENMKRMV